MSGEVKHGGWRLAAYHWEAETFKEFQHVLITRDRAEALLKKFARHFKVSAPTLSRKLKRGGGHYTPGYFPSITLGKVPTLGIVCHEFAHHLETARWNTRQWHGKKFKRELKRVYTFAKRYLPGGDKPPIA